MIGSLRGTLLDRSTSGEILVEVGGLGYRVTMSPVASVRVGEIGHEVFVHLHHHVRDDAQTLYGFATRDERVCFEALIDAHGVGPALALAILSIHEPDALHAIVAEDDLDALCLVPGVGKKTAQRLLVELESTLRVPESDGVRAATGGGNGSGEVPSARRDVREALAGLGYGPDEVRAALEDLPDGPDPGVLLKQALQRLATT